MRKRPRVDSTHGPIVEAFRAGGWKVLSLATIGNGAPDLLVSPSPYHATHPLSESVYLIEVKTGSGKLRKAQEDFAKSWPVHVLRSVDEAIAFMKGR